MCSKVLAQERRAQKALALTQSPRVAPAMDPHARSPSPTISGPLPQSVAKKTYEVGAFEIARRNVHDTWTVRDPRCLRLPICKVPRGVCATRSSSHRLFECLHCRHREASVRSRTCVRPPSSVLEPWRLPLPAAKCSPFPRHAPTSRSPRRRLSTRKCGDFARDKFYDPKMKGLDWETLGNRHRFAYAAAKTDASALPPSTRCSPSSAPRTRTTTPRTKPRITSSPTSSPIRCAAISRKTSRAAKCAILASACSPRTWTARRSSPPIP